MRGLSWRFPDGLPEGYNDRIEFELGVISAEGLPRLLPGGRRPGAATRARSAIRVGPGRGSAAGSLRRLRRWASPNLDPIEHGLLFERFLNPERVGHARHRPRLRRPPARRDDRATPPTSRARTTSPRSSRSARSRPRPRSRTPPASCTASPASRSPTGSPRRCRRRSWRRTSRCPASSTRSTSATPRPPRSARWSRPTPRSVEDHRDRARAGGAGPQRGRARLRGDPVEDR